MRKKILTNRAVLEGLSTDEFSRTIMQLSRIPEFKHMNFSKWLDSEDSHFVYKGKLVTVDDVEGVLVKEESSDDVDFSFCRIIMCNGEIEHAVTVSKQLVNIVEETEKNYRLSPITKEFEEIC